MRIPSCSNSSSPDLGPSLIANPISTNATPGALNPVSKQRRIPASCGAPSAVFAPFRREAALFVTVSMCCDTSCLIPRLEDAASPDSQRLSEDLVGLVQALAEQNT